MEQAGHQQSVCSGGFALCWVSTIVFGAAEPLYSGPWYPNAQAEQRGFAALLRKLCTFTPVWLWIGMVSGKTVYFTRKGGFSSSPRMHACMALTGWCDARRDISNSKQPQFFFHPWHFYISTFDTFFAFIFFFHRLNIHMSYPVQVVVLMDGLPTKTLGFRWLILCDCNGL